MADPVLSRADVANEARVAADAVARGGGLVVREIDQLSEHRAAQQLLSRVWRTDRESPPISGDLMRALAHAGAYVAGAFLDEELVGATAAFLAAPPGGNHAAELHSHITGVVPEARGRHAGFALKLHQRAWALEREIATITWTFDPLVRRNAYFNLAKLGARVTSYLVDFYGDMVDGVNAGQGSDRLLASWWLASEGVATAAAGSAHEPDVAEAVAADRVLLSVGSDGWPCLGEPAGSGSLVCAIPADIEQIRRTDADLARAWRHRVRDAFGGAMADGQRVAGITRSGWYLLTAKERQ